MATATKKDLQQFDVVLTLSKEEAQTLLDVMRKIGGSPQGSRRKYTASIEEVLSSVEGLKISVLSTPKDMANTGIWFYDSDLVTAQ